MKHEISVDYNAQEDKKAESTPETLDGWDGFVCKSCNKAYRRMPIRGICDCGGEMLISYHGSTGNKVKIK